MQITRLPDNPILYPFMDRWMGQNINGPSAIEAPEWLPNRRGRYYLYFAHHYGTYIRLAYADHPEGPWRTYEDGVLDVRQSYFIDHIASPDIHVDNTRREIHMYFHGVVETDPAIKQGARLAVSYDGLNFSVRPDILGPPYIRAFHWRGATYALARLAALSRSPDGLQPFEPGPDCGFPPDVRHVAVALRGDVLHVVYSCIGDAPERLYHTTIALTEDWREWKVNPPREILRPGRDYEGADKKIEPSKIGAILSPVNELRDPDFFHADGEDYLLYSIAGEHGVAIAKIDSW